MSHAAAGSKSKSPLDVLRQLHNVKIGGVNKNPSKTKLRRKDLEFILSNLSTLVENGVSLPRALDTLARERAMKQYAFLLDTLRRNVEAGESFSSALAAYPATFDDLMVNQIRVGERSGKVAEALARITSQLEQGDELRSKIMKRLSYPMIVMGAGGCVVAFMLLYIVPTFKETYEKANITLPTPTRLLMALGDFAVHWGWAVPLVLGGLVWFYLRLRKNPAIASWMDRVVVKTPVLGNWVRDIAVLQLMQVLGVMLESGFKVVDALGVSVGSIGNRAVRGSVEDLQAAVLRGERLSRQIERHGDLFPPIVRQLVIVGEQTGNLPKATRHVAAHLRKDIERKADILIGAMEPVLTLGLALLVCGILLAIYLPMFSMVDAVRGG